MDDGKLNSTSGTLYIHYSHRCQLGIFALVVFAYPYCTRISCRRDTSRLIWNSEEELGTYCNSFIRFLMTPYFAQYFVMYMKRRVIGL